MENGNIEATSVDSVPCEEAKELKVLHIIGSVDRRHGGPIEGICQLAAERLHHAGETHIACLDSPGDPWVANCPVKAFALGIRNPTYIRLRRHVPWLRYGYTPHLVPWLRKHLGDYDIVVVNGLWNYAAFGAWRALRGSKMPYVVFTHGMLDPWFRTTYPLKHLFKQLLWWVSEGRLLANARATLFTSDEERLLARNAFWPYRVLEKVVGYGAANLQGVPEAQINSFRAAVPSLGDRSYLLFLSRIHKKKGCDLLIDAFAKVAAEQPDVDLVIAGPDQEGWRRILQERAKALGIAGRVHWPGMLTGDAKWGAFRACEAFILPSHQENFGIVVAEAMAAGRPVLITNKVNIWREVEAEGAGLIAEDDAQGIQDLLARYFSMTQQERDQMGKNALGGFLRNFEIGQAYSTIEQTLHEAMAR